MTDRKSRRKLDAPPHAPVRYSSQSWPSKKPADTLGFGKVVSILILLHPPTRRYSFSTGGMTYQFEMPESFSRRYFHLDHICPLRHSSQPLANKPPPLCVERPITSGPGCAVANVRRNRPERPPRDPNRTLRTSILLGNGQPRRWSSEVTSF